MRNIYLAQVNNTYGNNAFLPYSVGLLQAYALTNETIKSNYAFKGFVYLREPFEDVATRMSDPDVFGVSCYIWNWHYSISLAKYIKSLYPNCLIVLGGPQVPVRSERFFEEHPYADILVHYEGEVTFSEILLERIKEKPDYTKIEGISICPLGKVIQTPMRTRLTDLDVIPSPYLEGVFDELMLEPYDLHATSETNRGCPYFCQFCDWGSSVFTKVRTFSTERLIQELTWFAKNKIDLLYNADANYGILPRDLELTKQMVDIKKEYGFPNKFRAAYAKNSNETIYKIATMLNEAGMNKGITLSFQSMDDKTLELVKRKNIKIENFKEIMERYRFDGIATYSELIVGLPGETYDSFANGIDKLIECGQHDSIQVYVCELLPNSEMSHPEYRKLHRIKSAFVPVLFFHGTPSIDPYQEYYELVVGTNVLPTDDWLKCLQFSWIIQCLHCLSLTQYIAVFMNAYYKMSYRKFYELLLRFGDDNPDTLFGKISNEIKELFQGIPQGKAWGVMDQRFGNIVWPPEEGAFLKLITNKDIFYYEIYSFLKDYGDGEILRDVFEYQRAIIKDPFDNNIKIDLSYNIHDFIHEAYFNKIIELQKETCNYIVEGKDYKDLETYAREVVWYNRKGGTFANNAQRI